MQERRAAQEEGKPGEILATREELAEWLGADFGVGSRAEGAVELQRFLDYIARRSGLLLPRGEGRYGFAHLSFQEYYAACHMQREFRRIQRLKTGGGGFFGGRAASSGEVDPERIFSERAAISAWREPLLFLAERLGADENDTSVLLGWLFPQLGTEPVPQQLELEAEPPPLMPLPAAELLAALSLDKHVKLADEERRSVWTALWQAHLAQQHEHARWRMAWHLAPALLAASAYQSEVFHALVALQPKKLILSDCTALSDLTPLTGLASLKEINLNGCTAVSDLTPLTGLASLQEIYLNGCTAVSDLTPLTGLASLQELYLNGCTAVSDLTPLTGLASLRSLYLIECTAVSDVTPLTGLASLQLLWLDGCTSVSEGSVVALRAKLPNLKIQGR